MIQPLVHIYGPIAIHPYGLCATVAIGLGIWLMMRHPWSVHAAPTHERLIDTLMLLVGIGIVGARAATVLLDPQVYPTWYDRIAIWDGGLSSLGAIGAILLTLPLVLRCMRVPPFPFLDLIALYAPMIQACMRMGCWIAGCCSGTPTALLWGVYNEDLHTYCHPTNAYSIALHLIIFLALYRLSRRSFVPHGTILGAYLVLTGCERLLIDRWRLDAQGIVLWHGFTVYQWTALMIMCLGGAILISCAVRTRVADESL